MPEALKRADGFYPSRYVFEVTEKEPQVTYWKGLEDSQSWEQEEFDVPRARRHTLKGLTLPVRSMFTVDFIPVRVDVSLEDIITGLESREEVDQRHLTYYQNLSGHLVNQRNSTIGISAGGGELYLASEVPQTLNLFNRFSA